MVDFRDRRFLPQVFLVCTSGKGGEASENRKLEEKPVEICREGLNKLNLRETGENLREMDRICGRLSASA